MMPSCPRMRSMSVKKRRPSPLWWSYRKETHCGTIPQDTPVLGRDIQGLQKYGVEAGDDKVVDEHHVAREGVGVIRLRPRRPEAGSTSQSSGLHARLVHGPGEGQGIPLRL